MSLSGGECEIGVPRNVRILPKNGGHGHSVSPMIPHWNFYFASHISLPINFIFNKIAGARRSIGGKRRHFGPLVASKFADKKTSC